MNVNEPNNGNEKYHEDKEVATKKKKRLNTVKLKLVMIKILRKKGENRYLREVIRDDKENKPSNSFLILSWWPKSY